MQIYLLITDNCNLNCQMCIRGKQTGENINFNKLKEIISSGRLNNHDVVITGGEPTLHNQFVDIVNCISNVAATVTVTTNGTTDYYLDGNYNLHNVHFQISLDGTSDVHDNIRGEGSFDKTIKTINRLDEKGYNYSVATVVSRNNKENMFELNRLLLKFKNKKFWKISYEMPFGNSDINNIMTSSEWNKFVDDIIKVSQFKLKIKKIFPFDLYQKKYILTQNTFNEHNRVYNCGSGINKLYIYPDFNVYPCTCLTDFPIGNIYDIPLEIILNGEQANTFVNYQVAQESICYSCEYLKFCNGGCIGMSYHYFGKLGMGDVRCPKFKDYRSNYGENIVF